MKSMPEQILATREPLEALHRIGEVLVHLRDDVAESRTSQAVTMEKLTTIAAHLVTLNGRTAKSEDRISVLETALAEARGAWKLAALAGSIPASAIGAAAMWWANHTGK
jgi:hypothetical protein